MANELAPDTPTALPDPFDDIASGKMPAVSLPPIVGRNTTPQTEFVVSNFRNLEKFGLEYHDFPDDGISVIYNPKLTTLKDLDAAKASGNLFQLAPLVGAPDPRAEPGLPPAEAITPPQGAPADVPSLASTNVPNTAAGALSSRNVPPNRKAQSASLQNQKQMQPKVAAPNPIPDQLARRAQ
jgi:hypothetical protein